jgi:HTH-type transcriptional regulator / antitoxin HipB
MDTQTVGKLIRDTRKALQMRQDELASVAGVSTRALSDIENGKPGSHCGLVLQTLHALGIGVTLTPPPAANLTKVSDI